MVPTHCAAETDPAGNDPQCAPCARATNVDNDEDLKSISGTVSVNIAFPDGNYVYHVLVFL